MITNKVLRVLLIILSAFLTITTVAGGIGLLTGAVAPPVGMLEGSPFASYTIPGLTLAIVVGDSALAATILLLRRHPWGSLAALFSALMIICFELVEVLIIGSPAGVARNLQGFYLGLGLLVAVLAISLWVVERKQE